MDFQGYAFGPGLPPGGTALPVKLDAFHLNWRGADGRPRSVALAQVQLTRSGFNDLLWNFQWTDAQGTWSVSLDDPVLQQQLINQPPAGLVAAIQRLRSAQRSTTLRRSVGWGALATWLALPLLLLIALGWNAGRISGWVATAVPVEREQQLGELIWKQQKTGVRLIENTAANDAVKLIGGQLTQGSRYTYQWYVAREPSINAYAIPGGIVVVHSGLIEAAKSPEELAGVMAHEVQHVEQRHSLKSLMQSAGIAIAVGLATGDLSGAAALAAQLGQLKFSRDHEREADAEGLKTLRRAQMDPQGMVGMFETLEKEAGSVKPPAFLSTHPDTGERIARLKELIASEPAGTIKPIAVDWKTVQDSLK